MSINWSVQCKINTVNSEIYIVVCYKSPTVTDEEKKDLFSLSQEVLTHQVLIMCDFNYPSISWEIFMQIIRI